MSTFNVSKPNVAPPSDIRCPDPEQFLPLLSKYASVLQTDAMSDCARYKAAIDDVILLNFTAISYYMDKVVYRNSSARKREIEAEVKTVSSQATILAWAIGKEWASKDPTLRDRLKGKSQISAADIPADAMELLGKVVGFPYSIFAAIESNYYSSIYGRGVRYQKDAHLKDTYQSLMKAMVVCFLYGIQSNP
jgi:hypothetical protein